MSAAEIREALALQPHPEGGHYREVYRSERRLLHPHVPESEPAVRSALTLIYFLLERGEFSAFHRVRSDEVWSLLAGGPLELHMISREGELEVVTLGMDLRRGEVLQHVVPAEWWQAARLARGAEFALLGCAVAPGFDFADFSLPPGEELVKDFPHLEREIRELTR
jgi:predicted cupin superfamily sugar epimerase